MEGDAETCRLLLDRLVRLAGERDVSGWCPTARRDVWKMFEMVGLKRQFRDDFQGRPSYFYSWARNAEVKEPPIGLGSISRSSAISSSMGLGALLTAVWAVVKASRVARPVESA